MLRQTIQHDEEGIREEEEANLPGAELCPGMGFCLPMAGVDICSLSIRLSCKPMSPSQQNKTPPLNYLTMLSSLLQVSTVWEKGIYANIRELYELLTYFCSAVVLI